MIYLDVTSSCKSPMNTGVQRVVRGIFRALIHERVGLTPVLWEPRLADYCRLSRREHGFLTAPFAGRAGGRARREPGRLANRVPGVSKWWRQVVHRRNQLHLAARLTAADALFVPEIFQDNRIAWLRELRAARHPAPRVAVFHDAIAWKRPDITPAARLGGFDEYMAALAGFDTVFAISNEAAADLRGFWQTQRALMVDAAVRVANLPINEEVRSAAPGMRQSRKSEAPSPVSLEHAALPRVLCVGTFEPRKNHRALLRAAEEVWRAGVAFTLVLAGRTTAGFGAQVETEIGRLRAAGGAVEWLRHVSDATLAAEYERAVFTAFPSLVEGYGLPILESLSHGRPVLCGGNGALGELAARGGCLVVDQTEPRALAAGLRRLLTEPALRARLAAEATQRQFPSWPEYVAEVLAFLQPTQL